MCTMRFNLLSFHRLLGATVVKVCPQGDRPEVESVNNVDRDPTKNVRLVIDHAKSCGMLFYITAIMLFHPFRNMMSIRIHSATTAAMPIEILDIMTSASGS